MIRRTPKILRFAAVEGSGLADVSVGERPVGAHYTCADVSTWPKPVASAWEAYKRDPRGYVASGKAKKLEEQLQSIGCEAGAMQVQASIDIAKVKGSLFKSAIARVGADPTTPSSSSSAIPDWAMPTGIGAAAGLGVGLIGGASIGWLIPLTTLGGALGYLISQVHAAPSGLTCPDTTSAAFQKQIADIKSGAVDATTAENLAKGYDNGSCPDAAAAIRAAASGARGPLVVAPQKPVPQIPITPTPIAKPKIGSAYVTHKLTKDEAAESVSSFRIAAGFADDDEFLGVNTGIAVYDPGDQWPVNAPFTYVISGDYTGAGDEPHTYTPTGKIEAGVGRPTYIESESGREVYFTPFGMLSVNANKPGPHPAVATNSGGQRMGIKRGVWAWDEGLVVNVKTGSVVAKVGMSRRMPKTVNKAPNRLLTKAEMAKLVACLRAKGDVRDADILEAGGSMYLDDLEANIARFRRQLADPSASLADKNDYRSTLACLEGAIGGYATPFVSTAGGSRVGAMTPATRKAPKRSAAANAAIHCLGAVDLSMASSPTMRESFSRSAKYFEQLLLVDDVPGIVAWLKSIKPPTFLATDLAIFRAMTNCLTKYVRDMSAALGPIEGARA